MSLEKLTLKLMVPYIKEKKFLNKIAVKNNYIIKLL